MKRVYSGKNSLKSFLLLVSVTILSLDGFAFAAKEARQKAGILLDTYYRIEAKLEKNSFGVPLYLESGDESERVHVDVYAVLNYPYGSVADMLKVPANWCDIAVLHPNVKACTYSEAPGMRRLTFYGGRKTYQPPKDTYKFNCRYQTIELQQGHLDVVLSADEGPFGTKNHRIWFEAIPLDKGRTFVHLSCAYRYGFSMSLAEKIYFATLGRRKVGFTVNGIDKDGKPVYIGGPRGAIERNAMRYFFAIQSLLDTMQFPEESRFRMRISEWYDLTSRYRKQLFEMDKKDYLLFKTEEHKNQLMLQRRITASLE